MLMKKLHDCKIEGPNTNTLNPALQTSRLSTTLTLGSRVGLGWSITQTSNPYNFCMHHSNETYFGALKPHSNSPTKNHLHLYGISKVSDTLPAQSLTVWARAHLGYHIYCTAAGSSWSTALHSEDLCQQLWSGTHPTSLSRTHCQHDGWCGTCNLPSWTAEMDTRVRRNDRQCSRARTSTSTHWKLLDCLPHWATNVSLPTAV